MSREAQGWITGTAAAVVTGGIAFAAARHFSSSKRLKRKATAKALKVLGNIMDAV